MLYFSRLLFSVSGQLQQEATSTLTYRERLISGVILVQTWLQFTVIILGRHQGVLALKWPLLWGPIRHVIPFNFILLIRFVVFWLCFQGIPVITINTDSIKRTEMWRLLLWAEKKLALTCFFWHSGTSTPKKVIRQALLDEGKTQKNI